MTGASDGEHWDLQGNLCGRFYLHIVPREDIEEVAGFRQYDEGLAHQISDTVPRVCDTYDLPNVYTCCAY